MGPGKDSVGGREHSAASGACGRGRASEPRTSEPRTYDPSARSVGRSLQARTQTHCAIARMLFVCCMVGPKESARNAGFIRRSKEDRESTPEVARGVRVHASRCFESTCVRSHSPSHPFPPLPLLATRLIRACGTCGRRVVQRELGGRAIDGSLPRKRRSACVRACDPGQHIHGQPAFAFRSYRRAVGRGVIATRTAKGSLRMAASESPR